MKSIYKLILIASLIFLYSSVMAQEGTVIRGRITDTSSGEPLPGVNVVEMDGQNRVINGVITDVNGNYVFEVSNKEHTIRVSFIGYESQTFKINDRSRINIELVPKSMDIEQVTVTAQAQGNTMTGVADRDQTSSSMKVDMEKLNSAAGVSAAEALQGQVSGLDIVSASGAPGSGSSIVIRGMGSIGNTNPLIVVDGIPQDVNTQDFNFAAADQRDLGQLLNVAPQDIKSVEVLKDAASTAVWGSKGANGVLLIETNLGSKGEMKFNYQYKVSANIQPPPVPMLNGDEYITMQLEQWHNARGIYDIPQEIAYDKDYVDFYNYSANTDWIGEITKDSYTHDHFFKMSGGGKKSRYYTSINYQKEYGTTMNTSFRRFSVRVNFDYEISDDLRFTTNFSYANTFREDNAEFGGVYVGGNYYSYDKPLTVRKMSYIKAPNMSIWEYDENGNPTGEYFTPIQSYQGSGDSYFNPVAIANLSKNDRRGNEIQNNFKINYNIFDWLKFKETISFTYNNTKNNQFVPSSAIGVDWLSWDNNKGQENNIINTRILSRSQFFIKPLSNLRDHFLNGVLMWEMEESQNEWMNLQMNKTPSLYITDPASGAPVNWMGSDKGQSRLFGALASVNYKYKDRYLFTLNVRGDGSSAFGENNRWGIFPSVSVGWRFSEENFLQGWTFLNDSKLRLSWGQSGRSLDNPYARYSYYETSGRYMESPVVIPTQIQLTNLKWQTVTSWNLGLDLNLFDERVNITADAYKKLTTDLLWDYYDIPRSTGYNSLRFFNGGKLRNIGWEYYMSGTIIDQQDLQLSLNFNISQNVNSFLSFPDNFNLNRGSSIGNGTFPRKAEKGKPIGSFYGFRYKGVYPSDEDAVARDANGNIIRDSNGDPVPMTYQGKQEFEGGDAKYEDINHDGKIDIMDAVYIGDSSPEFIGGFGTSLKYKQWSASVNFYYRLGFDIVNEVAMDTEGMVNRNNQSKAVLHRWKREGQDEEGLLPRAYMNHQFNNLGSDRYVEPGDFLRMNNVNITYRLDPSIAKKLNLNSLDIGLNMRKLLTFTNYTGQDPEIGRVESNPFWMGTDNARTPVPRIYSLRVILNF
jgi:TonB-linked SusC/RagA family outer membrane protein